MHLTRVSLKVAIALSRVRRDHFNEFQDCMRDVCQCMQICQGGLRSGSNVEHHRGELSGRCPHCDTSRASAAGQRLRSQPRRRLIRLLVNELNHSLVETIEASAQYTPEIPLNRHKSTSTGLSHGNGPYRPACGGGPGRIQATICRCMS